MSADQNDAVGQGPADVGPRHLPDIRVVLEVSRVVVRHVLAAVVAQQPRGVDQRQRQREHRSRVQAPHAKLSCGSR